jgi:hypothetical protein
VASRGPGRARRTGVPRLWGCGRPVHARRADLGAVDSHHQGRAAHRWLSRLERWRLQPRPRPRRTGCDAHPRLSRRSYSKRSRSLENLNSEKVRATPSRAPAAICVAESARGRLLIACLSSLESRTEIESRTLGFAQSGGVVVYVARVVSRCRSRWPLRLATATRGVGCAAALAAAVASCCGRRGAPAVWSRRVFYAAFAR